MKKYDPLWSDLNTLLTYLREFEVADSVQEHFAKFNNSAPAQLLRSQIDKVQKHLDTAESAS